MSSVIDEKRRVTLPKSLTEEFGLSKGMAVVFRKGKDAILMKKADESKDSLEETMSWNPKRTSRPERIGEREMKGIWH